MVLSHFNNFLGDEIMKFKIGVNIGTKRLYNEDFKVEKGLDKVILWEVLEIQDGEKIKITFLNKVSNNRQGIWLATDKGISVNNLTLPQIDLWEDTAPKEETTITCYTDVGLLSFYNIWDNGNGRNSQVDSSGMIVEEKGNKLIYRCNDYGFDTNFEKLIFSIEKMKD
jgi:hypothetical protein